MKVLRFYCKDCQKVFHMHKIERDWNDKNNVASCPDCGNYSPEYPEATP